MFLYRGRRPKWQIRVSRSAGWPSPSQPMSTPRSYFHKLLEVHKHSIRSRTLLIDLITHSICPVRFTSSTARLVAGAKLSLKADLRAAQSIPRGLSDGTQVSLSHPQTIGTSCETYACDFVRNRTHKTKTRAEARCVTHRLLSRRCDGAT